MPVPDISRLDAKGVEAALDDLAGLLRDAVEDGAGVSFVPPFSRADAATYWRGVLPDVDAGRRVVLAARLSGRVVGTATLDRARVPNGRHRAEVQKVLVAREHRGRGLATALLAEVERVAVAEGVTLLVLDTGAGETGAGRLYERAGYVRVGEIPRYWRTAEGDLAPTVFFYKVLDGAARR